MITTTKIKDLGNNQENEYIIPTIVFDSTPSELQKHIQLQQLQKENKINYYMKRVSMAMNDIVDQIVPKKQNITEQTEQNEMLIFTDAQNQQLQMLQEEKDNLRQKVVNLQNELDFQLEQNQQSEMKVQNLKYQNEQLIQQNFQLNDQIKLKDQKYKEKIQFLESEIYRLNKLCQNITQEESQKENLINPNIIIPTQIDEQNKGIDPTFEKIQDQT